MASQDHQFHLCNTDSENTSLLINNLNISLLFPPNIYMVTYAASFSSRHIGVRNSSFACIFKGKGERKGVCGQVWWPILGICALHLTHPSAHTHSSEHTPGAVGSQCCGARGAVGGSVPCSRVSPQLWYWRWRECWLFTPPTYNPCRTWDSNPRPSGYKSNSLSIRPRLPHSVV